MIIVADTGQLTHHPGLRLTYHPVCSEETYRRKWANHATA